MLSQGKLGFWGLTALVFGLVVGVGIFNLPQNMATVASPAGVLLSWMLVAAGVLPLVVAFRWLSHRYPEYNAGIYHYAQAGFGNYIGFNIAWGYWLCTAFSNVAYGVMLNDAFGALFPTLLRHDWWSVLFCSALIWLMYFIVSRGLKTAKAVNTSLAVVKVVMILFIIAVFAVGFSLEKFELDFSGVTDFGKGTLWHQAEGTMMVALFCFFGIEGAVMMSSRARRQSDVGKAGVAGFILALTLYVAVSVLCYGVATRARMAGMPNPSVAYILRDVLAPWAYWVVTISVIVALLGGWVAWTLVVAQVPYEASRVGILPRWFSHTNSQDMPDFGLLASSLAMELFLILVVFAHDAYLTALQITGLMIIPGYLLTGLFVWKKADTWGMKVVAALIVAFCAWMAWAGGLILMLETSVFYLAGTGMYIRAMKEKEQRPFTKSERWMLCILILASVASVTLLLLGYH